MKYSIQQEACTKLLPSIIGKDHAAHINSIVAARRESPLHLQHKYLLLDVAAAYATASALGIDLHDVIADAYAEFASKEQKG